MLDGIFFSDLNKRTGLIATRAFLDINGYIFLVPLSAVRFSVQIADDQNTKDEYTQRLIRKIAKWIKKYTGSRQNLYDLTRASKNTSREFRLLIKLNHFKPYPLRKFLVGRWMAFDIYPEYKTDSVQALRFIQEMQDQSFNDILGTFEQWSLLIQSDNLSDFINQKNWWK